MTDVTNPVPEALKVPVASESAPPASEAPEPVKAESEPAPEGSPPEDATPDGEEKKKKPASGRIAELFAQKRQAEARAIASEAEARVLREQTERLLHQLRSGELSPEDADRVRVREAVRAERADQLEAEARREAQAAMSRQREAFYEKVNAVRDRMPDFDEVFGNVNRDLPPGMAEVIAESEYGPQIAYHLGKNPAEWERIASLPPHRQGLELARIESKVSVPIRKVSNAPPPPPRLGGGSTPGAKDPSSMSDAEYSAWYRARQKRA